MSFKAWAQTKIPVAHRVIKTIHESKTMRIRNIYNLQPGDHIHRLCPISSTGLRFGIFDHYDGDRTYAFFGNTPDIRSTITTNDLTSNIHLGWPGYNDDEDIPEPNPNPLGELLPNGFRVGERVYYVSPIGRDNSYRDTGTIVRNPRSMEGVPAENAVWANWDNGSTPGWMPTESVHRV